MAGLLENLEEIAIDKVGRRVHELADEGYRFVTITCCNDRDGNFDLIYSFDLHEKLVNLKTTVSAQAKVPSISQIYIAASFAENEISELFGLTIENKAIDYGGRFMLAQGAPESPFGGGVILVKKDGGTDAG